MPRITLPNQWSPRQYQLGVLRFFETGGRFAVSVWPRRHGKDSTALNRTACAAFERVGNYWHMFPQLKQARRAIWDGVDKSGRRIIDQAFPPEIRSENGYSDQEMKLRFANGSSWQLVGADNYDALVGSNPAGVVLSEWSLMDPTVWRFLSPILMENGGWAWFIYTPRGKNHGWDLYQRALASENWFAERLDVESCGVLDPQALYQMEVVENNMPVELFKQEYYCSFESSNHGAVFGEEMDRMRNEGRVREVPYDPNFPVETAWDLGVRDKTSIWFLQKVNGNVRFIDYEEGSGKTLGYWSGIVHSKPYSYIRHSAPHDIKQRESTFGTATGDAKRRIDIAAENFGIDFEVAPKLSLEDSINAARSVLAVSVMDAEKCSEGLAALDGYAWKYDEKLRIFSREPKHDWASHSAAALRTYAVMDDVVHQVAPWMQDLIKSKYPKQYGHEAELPTDWGDGMADPLEMFR